MYLSMTVTCRMLKRNLKLYNETPTGLQLVLYTIIIEIEMLVVIIVIIINTEFHSNTVVTRALVYIESPVVTKPS